MTSRPFPANPSSSFSSKTRVLFLALTISASLVILASILYFLFHLWQSLVHRAKTIPFDSTPPLKLQRFSYRELKIATNDFDIANIIGKGGSGTVFRGTLRTGKVIAIKRLDVLSLQTEREFQNELQILGGLRSPFLVTLVGYCADKNNRVLIYEYMPNKSLQELLFRDGALSLSWERRFAVVLDVARALEFLHSGCDPAVIHGDVKPSNVLLDFEFRAKLSDFGLSRVKVEGEFGVEMFSQDLGKSQELSGNFTAETNTPAVGTPLESGHNEVDFALALQASSSSKKGKALTLNSSSYNANIHASEKGKELVSSCVDFGVDCDWNHRFVPYDQEQEPCSVDHSKELANPNPNSVSGDDTDTKQWGKDWWWRQDGSGELNSKDYVSEWIGTQVLPSRNPNWEEEKTPAPAKPDVEKTEEPNGQAFEFVTRDQKDTNLVRKKGKKKPRKMQEWWREEHLAEISKKSRKNGRKKLKSLEIKLRKGLKTPHFDLGRKFYFRRRTNKFADLDPNDDGDCIDKGEFSFRRGWRKKNKNENSCGSDMWSGDLFSRELSSTTSMRGTLCYVAPEYGGFGCLMEKSDIYSLGVLILVIVSGRRPLHVLASPMKLEKANLISWCRQLAQSGNILELVDERLRDDYDKDQAALCINLALVCLQRSPEMRPEIGEVVRILRGEIEVPPLPFEFSPSPPSKLYSRSKRKHKLSAG